jgi:hypothetical protein
VVAEAAKEFKEELIEQVFDAPHGMGTAGVRKGIAPKILANLSRDQIRPYLPRFLEALHRPGGGTMQGSMIILASFTEDVLYQVELLAENEDLKVRENALRTLHMMALKEDASPDVVARAVRRLEKATASGDVNLADMARRLLQELNNKKKQEK